MTRIHSFIILLVLSISVSAQRTIDGKHLRVKDRILLLEAHIENLQKLMDDTRQRYVENRTDFLIFRWRMERYIDSLYLIARTQDTLNRTFANRLNTELSLINLKLDLLTPGGITSIDSGIMVPLGTVADTIYAANLGRDSSFRSKCDCGISLPVPKPLKKSTKPLDYRRTKGYLNAHAPRYPKA